MFSSYYDWNNFATDKNPALTLFIVQNFPLPSFHSSFNIVMSGSKAPDFDAYGLFRATHSHNPTLYSHIVGLSSHFYAHSGAGPKVFHPLMSKLIWV